MDMNFDIDKVLDDYRKGDESKRLGLFLAYRDLRDYFDRIEHESSHDDFKVIKFPKIRNRHLARAA